jgi:hypothetical protein
VSAAEMLLAGVLTMVRAALAERLDEPQICWDLRGPLLRERSALYAQDDRI